MDPLRGSGTRGSSLAAGSRRALRHRAFGQLGIERLCARPPRCAHGRGGATARQSPARCARRGAAQSFRQSHRRQTGVCARHPESPGGQPRSRHSGRSELRRRRWRPAAEQRSFPVSQFGRRRKSATFCAFAHRSRSPATPSATPRRSKARSNAPFASTPISGSGSIAAGRPGRRASRKPIDDASGGKHYGPRMDTDSHG